MCSRLDQYTHCYRIYPYDRPAISHIRGYSWFLPSPNSAESTPRVSETFDSYGSSQSQRQICCLLNHMNNIRGCMLEVLCITTHFNCLCSSYLGPTLFTVLTVPLDDALCDTAHNLESCVVADVVNCWNALPRICCLKTEKVTQRLNSSLCTTGYETNAKKLTQCVIEKHYTNKMAPWSTES